MSGDDRGADGTDRPTDGAERAPAADAYEELADAYAAEVRENPYNAHLEFPATTDLLPDVAGDRVLDAGCGTGVYSEWLLDRGAEVVGLDVSASMLDNVPASVRERAPLVRADLDTELPLADDAFDGVVSALALNHVRDWETAFREFARVLRPGGFLVLSVPHPFDEFPVADDESYFAIERRTRDWDVEVPYYSRPLAATVNPLLHAGFRLAEVVEPQPTEAFAEAMPERYEKESRQPVFLCLRATLE